MTQAPYRHRVTDEWYLPASNVPMDQDLNQEERIDVDGDGDGLGDDLDDDRDLDEDEE